MPADDTKFAGWQFKFPHGKRPVKTLQPKRRQVDFHNQRLTAPNFF